MEIPISKHLWMKGKKNLLLNILVIFSLIIITILKKSECFYKTLGLKRSATAKEIKKAFKKLSLKYHPDKNKAKKEWAKENFIKVANAYEALSDPKKKRSIRPLRRRRIK